MRKEQPTTIADILKASGLHRHRAQNGLQTVHHQAWQQITDKTLQLTCHLSIYRDGILYVTASNTTAATQLRYLNHILLQQLRSHPAFAELQKLQVNLSTRQTPPTPRTKVAPASGGLHPLSASTVEHLKNAAKFHDGSELSEVLLRLASRGRRSES